VFDAQIAKVENALDELIDSIGKEASSGAGVSISKEEGDLLNKFKEWRRVLDVIRGRGRPTPAKEPGEKPDLPEGGMFTD